MTSHALARLALKILEGAIDVPVGSARHIAKPVLLDYFRRNKVPLLPAADENEALARLFGGEEALESSRERRARYRDAYLALREGLHGLGFGALLTRGVAHFPYEHSNLDVLIRPEAVPAASALLERLGCVEITTYKEPFKLLFKKFIGPELHTEIHLHERVSWGVETYLATDELWRQSRFSPADSEMRIPSPTHACLQIFAHAIYENAELRLADLGHVRRLSREGAIAWRDLDKAAASLGWREGCALALVLLARAERELCSEILLDREAVVRAEGMIRRSGLLAPFLRRLASGSGVAFPIRISKLFSKVLIYRKILRHADGEPPGRIVRCSRTFAKQVRNLIRFPDQEPYLVSVSGADGSGKSSLIAALSSVIRSCDVHVTERWSRGGQSGPVAWLKASIRFLLGRWAGNEIRVRKDDSEVTSPFLRSIWPWVVAFELALFYFLRVRPMLWVRRFVICDRYFGDTLVDLSIRLGDPFIEQHPAFRLMRMAAPRPNLAFFLDVGAEKAFARKAGEVPIDHLKIRIDRYRERNRRNGWLRIDADSALEVVKARGIETTMKSYFELSPSRSPDRRGSGA